jgi:hypothetical protein
MNRSFPTNSENGGYDNRRWRSLEAADGVLPRSSHWAWPSSLSDKGGLVFSVLRISHLDQKAKYSLRAEAFRFASELGGH